MRDKAWRKKQEATHNLKKKYHKKGRPKQEEDVDMNLLIAEEEELLRQVQEDTDPIYTDPIYYD